MQNPNHTAKLVDNYLEKKKNDVDIERGFDLKKLEGGANF